MKRNRLLPFIILITIVGLMTIPSCSKNNAKNNNQQEIIVTVDANGKASGDHRFAKIDDTNFYIDDIRYTAQNGDLIVSGFDDAFFKGEAKLISQLNYDGRKMKVIAIGVDAFRDCKVLSSIAIPSGVTSIGQSAFVYCGNLKHVKVKMEIPVPISFMTFTNQGNTTLYVPYGSKAAYESSEYWNTEFKEIIEED